MNDDQKPHNPWVAPAAPVADIMTPVAPRRKPLPIWLLQIVSALAVLGFLRSAHNTFSMWEATSPGEIAGSAYMGSLLLHSLFVSLLILTIIAAQLRWPFGRWFGSAVLGALISITAYRLKTMPPDPGSIPQTVGFSLIAVFFLALPAFVIGFSIFSKKARAWYART